MVTWVLGAGYVILFFVLLAFLVNWRAELELRQKAEERAGMWMGKMDEANRELQNSMKDCIALKKELGLLRSNQEKMLGERSLLLNEMNEERERHANELALANNDKEELTNELDRLRQEHSDDKDELESLADSREKYGKALAAIEIALEKADWL